MNDYTKPLLGASPAYISAENKILPKEQEEKMEHLNNITLEYEKEVFRLQAMLKEQEEQIKNRDESLEKAREEIKWLRGMLKEQEEVKPECQIIFDVPYYFCGSCKTMLNMYAVKAKYCSNCGRRVKWG